jgi:hypothetical protein
MRSFSGRLGCFFLLIGLGLIVIFMASDVSRFPQYDFLIVGVLILAVGFSLWRRGRSEPRSSGRFRLMGNRQGNKPEDDPPDEI